MPISDIYGIKYSGLPPSGLYSSSPPTGGNTEYRRMLQQQQQRPCSGGNSDLVGLQLLSMTAEGSEDGGSCRGQLSTISHSSPRTNITVNPSEVSSHSWTPLLHLHQESVL